MIKEKEFDLAEGSFVEKLPKWSRWILFLPAAFIGSLIALLLIGILSFLSMSYIGATENGWWYQVFQLGQSYLLGLMFVLFGAVVIPRGQFIASIMLLVIAVLISVLVFLTNLSTNSTPTLLMLLHCILVVTGGCYAVYAAHKQEPLFNN